VHSDRSLTRFTRIDTPYIDPDKVQSQEDRGKWGSGKEFKRVFQKTYKIDLPVLIDEAHSPNHPHQFRSEAKEKWLGGTFKAGALSSR